jgi:hypothetical protein
LIAVIIVKNTVIAQTPKIYVNLGTHNEMLDEHYDTNESEYQTAKTKTLQILNHVNSIGAKWNFQTCSKFVLGALNWDDAATNQTDLLQTLQASGRVEIDPRDKRELPDYPYNISDVYHLLDSCGVTSTHTVGGFLAYPYNNEDWTQFRNPKIGAVYGEPWQAEIIWGGGSPGHVQDLNNYGVWKPKNGDTYANLYSHDPNANLWMVGNGCAPVISDSTTSVQWIVDLINSNAEHVLNGDWPSNKFYNLTLMINVRDFDLPGYLTKVQTVLNAIDAQVDAGAMEWAFISEKLDLFQSWSQQSNVPYSQWSCEEATTGNQELEVDNFILYPNPSKDEINLTSLNKNVSFQLINSQGKIINFGELKQNSKAVISIENLEAGVYFVKIETKTIKIIKE